MPPRLGHKKSRGGCVQCKRRRVKCDERKPICSACARHQKACSFIEGSPTPSLPRNTSQEISRPDAQDSSRLSSPARHVTPSSVDTTKPETNSFSLSDLQLLHHFTIETARSVSSHHELHDIFARVMPALAYKEEYVMRSILAIAALHIASSSAPTVDETMVATASYHLHEALMLGRPHLAQISEQNANALFCFSALVSLHSFAVPLYESTYGTPGQSIGKILEGMELVRGSSTVVSGGRTWVQKGPFSTFLELSSLPPPPKPIPDQITSHLKWLDEQIGQLPLVQEELDAYRDAIKSLKRCFQLIYSREASKIINFALGWAATVPQLYLEGLRLRKGPALAIMGYYCPLLQKQWGGWVFAGWQGWLLGDIEVALQGTYWCNSVMLAAAQLDKLLNKTVKLAP